MKIPHSHMMIEMEKKGTSIGFLASEENAYGLLPIRLQYPILYNGLTILILIETGIPFPRESSSIISSILFSDLL